MKKAQQSAAAVKSWKDLTRSVLADLPNRFTMGDLMQYKPMLAELYPNNRHIDAKLRQTLQILRDHGEIEFLGNGQYSRQPRRTDFSPHIDFTHTSGFSSAAQKARIALETWAELNLFCLYCDSNTLARLAANTPVSDFRCTVCESNYQLKGKDGRFGPKIIGAAYEPTLKSIRMQRSPDYLLMEYDKRFETVVFGIAIKGSSITESHLQPRRPLQPTARRAGWTGCTIRIDDLPKALIIEPMLLNRALSRERWRELC